MWVAGAAAFLLHAIPLQAAVNRAVLVRELELPRISLEGPVVPIDRESEAFGEAWPIYVERFPAAESRLALGDFSLFRLVPARGRYVGGFARALDVHPGRLAAALASSESL